MNPTWLQIAFLGLVQGAAELLPVSSSAHVIVAEKLMGLDPSAPSMTFLLVMLHTGTMAAVILYFWNAWKESYFSSGERFKVIAILVAAATLATLLVGGALKVAIEKILVLATHGEKSEIEHLFSSLPLIAAALVAAGLVILVSGYRTRHRSESSGTDVGLPSAGWIGAVQGLCLPFRGFSRSGATISAGLLAGISRRRAEEFSFALAV
ncbi:MAG TPA: undecaprenyl-diphosphate phosphatase, partial [Candidatus Methylacidiphilales bacterium]